MSTPYELAYLGDTSVFCILHQECNASFFSPKPVQILVSYLPFILKFVTLIIIACPDHSQNYYSSVYIYTKDLKVEIIERHCFFPLLQAALVRQLKAQGDVPKERIDEEVKKLLALKSKLGIQPTKGSSGAKKSKSKK